MKEKIPKVIHYCWFGKGEKPKLIKRCIESWKEVLKDYEIKEWNEENFDIGMNNFIKEAYGAKKYAFVSDFVRAYVLYNYGGIYLDTDVKVIKNFNNMLDNDSFWGFEEKNYIATSTIGCKKGNILIKKLLDSYEGKSFLREDGSIDTLTNVAIITKILDEYNIRRDGTLQRINGVGVFMPQEYFSPYDYINCYMKNSNNTYTIHYYYKSWLPFKERIKTKIKIILAKIFGGENMATVRVMIDGRR